MKVEVNGTIVQSKGKVTYIGVTIDQDLAGDAISNAVIGKINRGLKVLDKKSEYFTFGQKKMLFFASTL